MTRSDRLELFEGQSLPTTLMSSTHSPKNTTAINAVTARNDANITMSLIFEN
jgi:hypothetical protein